MAESNTPVSSRICMACAKLYDGESCPVHPAEPLLDPADELVRQRIIEADAASGRASSSRAGVIGLLVGLPLAALLTYGVGAALSWPRWFVATRSGWLSVALVVFVVGFVAFTALCVRVLNGSSGPSFAPLLGEIGLSRLAHGHLAGAPTEDPVDPFAGLRSTALSIVENTSHRLLIRIDTKKDIEKYAMDVAPRVVEVEWTPPGSTGYREASAGVVRVEERSLALEAIRSVSVFDEQQNMVVSPLGGRTFLRTGPGVWNASLQTDGEALALFPPYEGPRDALTPVLAALVEKLGVPLWEP